MGPQTDAIVVERLSKVYRVFTSPTERLKRFVGRQGRFLDVAALDDVTFSVPAGTALGVVGENGAGKSTLLKLVAGTTRPTSGTITSNGVVAAILELGAAFHPDFSGRDNAVLYGALIGLEAEAMLPRLDDILAFAELGEMIDHPIKSYSTGMVMRLAFAVATHVDPDILIIDEALAVGDGYFQKKCVDKILDIKRRGTTILFCSHAMYFVTQFCDLALWLKQGKLEMLGAAKQVVEAYEAHLLTREKRRLGAETAPTTATAGARVGRITRLAASSLSQRSAEELEPGDGLRVDVEVESVRREEAYHVGVSLDTLDGRCVLGLSTAWDECEPLRGKTTYRLSLLVPSVPVASGSFNLSAFLLDESGLHVHDQVVVTNAVRVNPPRWTPSLLSVAHSWARG